MKPGSALRRVSAACPAGGRRGRLPAAVRAAIRAAALAGAGAALAAPAAAQGVLPPARPLRPVLFAGLSGGGDTLAEVRFTNGRSERIDAGGLAHFAAGFVWEPQVTPYALQATIGFQSDRVNADNGHVSFTRYPLEVVGYYTGVPAWRFGIGARFVSAPELEVDVAGGDRVRFRDATGTLLEVGWQAAAGVWVGARLVRERYEVESVNGTAVVPTGQNGGNAVGVNVTLVF